MTAHSFNRTLVIGLGNEFRHDDAAGLIAVRRLREQGIFAEEHEGDMAALIEKWKGAEALIVIDAVVSGAVAGTVHRIDASSSSSDRELFKSSTHSFGLLDAIELSRTLGTLPPKVLVLGIAVRDVTAGVGLSAEVEAGITALVAEAVGAVYEGERISEGEK